MANIFRLGGGNSAKKYIFKDGVWQSPYVHQEIINHNASILVADNLIKMTATGQNSGNLKGEARLIITNLPIDHMIFVKFKKLNVPISDWLQFGIGSTLYCDGGIPSLALITTKPTIFADTVREVDRRFDLFLSVFANSTCSLEIEEIWLEKINN